MRSGRTFDLNYFFRTNPVTLIFISFLLLALLLSLTGQQKLIDLLVFQPSFSPQFITGLITYPLAIGHDLINSILAIMMLYWFGGSLERGWGTRRFVTFLLGSTIAAALCWWLGLFVYSLLPQSKPVDIIIFGPWLTISSIIIAWVILNPRETIMFWMIIPLKASWVGWGTLAMLYFAYPYSVSGSSPASLLLGIFALGGATFTWFFVNYQRKWGWIPRASSRLARKKRTGTGWLARWQYKWREMQRRRRVKKLQRTFHLDD